MNRSCCCIFLTPPRSSFRGSKRVTGCRCPPPPSTGPEHGGGWWKEVGALNPATLGDSRLRGRSVCSRLASHFVRTTSARTPSSPLTTCCYSCCFGPEKSLYHISTPPSPSLLPYFCLIRSLARVSLGPFFLFPSSSSCCKLGCLPPPHTSCTRTPPLLVLSTSPSLVPPPPGRILFGYSPWRRTVIYPPRTLIGGRVRWNASHMQITPGVTTITSSPSNLEASLKYSIIVNKYFHCIDMGTRAGVRVRPQK